MNEITAQQLGEIAVRALERSAFVFAEMADASVACVLPSLSQFALVRITGPVSGILCLGASAGFLRELAASILGVEPERVDPRTQGCDALKEMANMVAGSVALEYDGANRPYELGLPEAAEQAIFDVAARQCTLATVIAGGEPLSVAWCRTSATGSTTRAA